MVAEAIEKESQYPTQFKQAAINEAMLAYTDPVTGKKGSDVFSSAIQFRDSDRSIYNVSNNPLSDSWNQGWTGVTEAAYGVVDLIGDTAGWEGWQDVGQAGAERARARLSDYGTTITDYKDVDGFSTAMQYLGNNIALSLPYMAITTGAVAAAPATGGASLIAPVSVYTGQTWNEMEGENNPCTDSNCLLYTSPSPRDRQKSRMPSSA